MSKTLNTRTCTRTQLEKRTLTRRGLSIRYCFGKLSVRVWHNGLL